MRKLKQFCARFGSVQCVIELLEGIIRVVELDITGAVAAWERAIPLAEANGMNYYCAQAHYMIGFYSRVQDRTRRNHLLAARALFASSGDVYHSMLAEAALSDLGFLDLGASIRNTLGPLVSQSDPLFVAIDEYRSKVQLGEAVNMHTALVNSKKLKRRPTEHINFDFDPDIQPRHSTKG